MLGRVLADSGVVVGSYTDLVPFPVKVLHPGRTLIEKLLRVNNFAADPARRVGEHGWPRIGRQLYDIWALLGSAHVRELLADKAAVARIVASCLEASAAFDPDLPPPPGGFADSPAFDPAWEHPARLRREHDTAMRHLYYGSAPPRFDDVLAAVHGHRDLLRPT